MKDQAGVDHPLCRCELWESNKTLGICLAMDSNQDREEQECKKICVEFGAKMKASQCEPNVAQYAYKTHLIPKLKYRMPLTSFTRDQ